MPASGIVCDWSGSAISTESTLHQISPYIGKIKSSMAASLVLQFTNEGDLVYDPFSGSGTIALEAWAAKRRVIANDLSPYGCLLSRAKLFPYSSLDEAVGDIKCVAKLAEALTRQVDLRTVPRWVRQFFHSNTLRETVAWTTVFKRHHLSFLLGCLMGILHHQRPGFLSFPSSHTVPYLRLKRFPRSLFPDLYEYRSLRDRLEAKVIRALKRVPELDFGIKRSLFSEDAALLTPSKCVDAIITSPPYMRQLDYGRDNRLRLWFLGTSDWRSLDSLISPGEADFLELIGRCFHRWKKVLRPAGFCILVIGDACSRIQRADLPDLILHIAREKVGGYSLVSQRTEVIPNERRVRRGHIGSASETVLVFRNEASGAHS